MARPLFEQYKDALRRGHLALLGDELEAALAAYREAASLVPDRPLPHTSIGGVLERLQRPAEALAAYDLAVALAPDDPEVARARAAVVASIGGAQPGADAPPAPEVEPVTLEATLPPASAETPDTEPATAEAPDAGPSAATVSPDAAEPSVVPVPEPARGAWPAIDLPSLPPPPLEGPPPDPAVLQTEADALLDAGDTQGARDRLILAAIVHREAGRLDAAIDTCLQLLAIAPGDPRVHLAIANLQLDLGWRPVATEKIELLLRLTSLTGDAQAEADTHLLAADRLRDESPVRLDARRRGLPTP